MSVAMVLAVRPRRFERFFDGLDKTYRLHKWLGISALVIAIFHWGWGQIPKWLVGFGWLEKPARRAGEGQMHEGIFALLQRFRGLAETRSEGHPSELQSLMRLSYAVFRLKTNN